MHDEGPWWLTDPLGRSFVLSATTWDKHILTRHDDVEGQWQYVRAAVADPEQILFSRHDPKCRLYVGRGPDDRHKIQVIGDLAAGRIRTAYWVRASRVRGGGVEWPS